MRTPTPISWASGFLIALGSMVTAGWIFRIPALFEILPGFVPMVFNTGLCFLLSGLGLLLIRQPHRRPLQACKLISVFLVVLGCLTLYEFFTDQNLHIDMALVHQWHDYGNSRPGRMAPNTALGFTLIGITFLLLKYRISSKARAVAVIFLTFTLLGISLTGLAGYYLAPDLIFGWARSARMAVQTAVGMMVCAYGLWLTWSTSDWYTSSRHIREDEKIRFFGAGILLIIAVTAGLTGFVLQEKAVQRMLENRLDSELQSRSALYLNSVQNVAALSLTNARLSGLRETAVAVLSQKEAGTTLGRFSDLADEMIAEGFQGVALLGIHDELLLHNGTTNLRPVLSAVANTEGSLEMLWDQGMILRTRLPLMTGRQRLGTLLIDYPLSTLDKALFNPDNLGKSAEIAICTPRKETLLCLPGLLHDAPFTVKKRGPPYPMRLALDGKRGLAQTTDYRGKNVVAAYAPLAPGLGIVVKQETVELYAVIREALSYGTPFILVIGVLGAMLLYSQLQPLAAKISDSEASAREKALAIEAIVTAVGDGILTIDEQGLVQSANPVACQIFGYTVFELVGTGAMQLLPPRRRHNPNGRTIEQMARRLIGKHNVEITGRKKDGSNFALEMTLNRIASSGKPVLVAVLRNIVERKELETRLATLAHFDSLTGLPNRALFMDRIRMALTRATRSKKALALMFLDLDKFKHINDTYGHHCGDQLLMQFSMRLSALVRKVDTVARLAGDEFTVLLEGLSNPRADAEAVADKIMQSMKKPFTLDDQQVHVSVSLGFVVLEHGFDNVIIADLLKCADQEMYAVKRNREGELSKSASR